MLTLVARVVLLVLEVFTTRIVSQLLFITTTTLLPRIVNLAIFLVPRALIQPLIIV